MSEQKICHVCGEPLDPNGFIPCYICGRDFHFTVDRECGNVAPQTIGC